MSHLHFDVIRPTDLVALRVDALNFELVEDAGHPAHLLAGSQFGRLIVGFGPQHLGEEAIYEGMSSSTVEALRPGDGPDARPRPPVGMRPARSSRLVFRVPEGETIEYSTTGILAAMRRLKLLVHNLALPGNAPPVGQTGENVLLIPPWLAEQLFDEVPVHPNDLWPWELRRIRQLARIRPGIVDVRDGDDGRGRRIGRPVDEVFWHRFPVLSYPPGPEETAIEAPYRLVISPSDEARWAHADSPVLSKESPWHIELWHSRLAIARTTPDGTTVADERDARRRIVRAIWARDRDTAGTAWRDPGENLGQEPPFADPGFRMSLDRADRHMLVRQSAETWPGGRRSVEPVPVGANALWLSSLGAWLDLHGGWTTKPYSQVHMTSILGWDHIAPLGRDQYVRVTYPGYLYPWGHQAALVKVTQRKMKDVSPSVASLYQRMFLVINEPQRVYGARRDLPFTSVEIRPLVTPTLDEPSSDERDSYFWPSVGGQRFGFIIDAVDHDGAPVRLQMPLIWVAEHFQDYATIDDEYADDGDRHVGAAGQRVAFAPARPPRTTAAAIEKGEDATAEAATLSFLGRAGLGDSTPRMSSAKVTLPAVQKISGVGPVPIAYHELYRKSDFAGSGGLWARVLVQGEAAPEHHTDSTVALPVLAFGQAPSGPAPSGTDKGGGFVAPNLPIRALSRESGVTGSAAVSGNPKDYLQGSVPKLFGLFALDDLFESDLTKIPEVVSEVVDRIEAFIADMAHAAKAVGDAVAEAQRMVVQAAGGPQALIDAAEEARALAESVKPNIDALVDDLPAKIASLKGRGEAEVEGLLQAYVEQILDEANTLKDLAAKLPLYMGNVLRAVADLLIEVAGAPQKLYAGLYKYVNGFVSDFALVRFRYEWQPELVDAYSVLGLAALKFRDPWPGAPKGTFRLAITGQAGGNAKPGTQILAELSRFALVLPADPLVRLSVERLAFAAGSTAKPGVDLLMKGVEFLGVLSFVSDLADAIPLDAFSDPPNIDVTADGMVAGVTIALPDIPLGMFSITNLSIGADVQVPFFGKVVTVGFNFCTRERPFMIAVVLLGGGGWCGVRIAPDGLAVLEIGLEAGACIAVDLGVASGVISVTLGVYIRLEGDEGSIAGFYRMRGEVEVLGVVSAGLELYMELKYDTLTGKLTGRARVTLHVSIGGIEKSVSVEASRSFAGSKGDPPFRKVMGAESGVSPYWSTYCLAFDPE
ncbi:hypothetical protein [Mycolicibacterium sp. HK-90]|uniref:hypothetical protein n=1 Tax=Mycolicibacterium sp. HK-90 TaxID=3056937 RepID=UPI00265AA88E|nr:hypothetical protein [Mycolicibacterium sp. HK-90]WKG05511.1 hypothetical protein QU592_10715 [Mycolicibacterium sp. HK-90]